MSLTEQVAPPAGHFRPPELSPRTGRTSPPGRMIAFLALTFVISWTCWGIVLLQGGDYLAPAALPFFLTGSFGPLLAALAMRARTHGERPPPVPGSRRLARTRWLPAALLIGSAGALTAVLGTAAFGGPGTDLAAGGTALYAYGSPILFFVVNLVLGPLSEEPGWRGYLHPRLRQHAGPLPTALVIGPIWTLWHLPLFLIPGTYQHSLGIATVGGLLFGVSTTALAVAVAFAAERLGGLPAAIAVHAASNIVPVLFGLTSQTASVWDAAAKIAVAVLLLLHWRPVTATTGIRASGPPC